MSFEINNLQGKKYLRTTLRTTDTESLGYKRKTKP